MLGGLLDLFKNMTPEQRMGLLSASAAMMQSKGNFGQAAGAGLQQGLLGYQGAMGQKDRRAEEEQQRQMRQMQIDQMKRQGQEQEQVRSLATRAFAPPQTAPNDPYEAHQTPGGGGMPEFAKGLLQIDPMRAVAMQQQIAQSERPDYMPVSPGASVWDKRAGKVVHTAPEKTPDWKDPAYQKFQMDRAVAGRPSVNVTNVGERQEAKDLGALRAKNYGDLQALAASARKENSLLSGLERIPLETGKLTPANATVSAWLVAAGAKDEDMKRIASGAQTFEAFTNDLVMQQQLAQKGPQTESDAKRLQMTQAQLSNTPEANRLNITYRKAMTSRIIEQERFYANHLRKNGTLDGADEAWFSGKGGASIWDEPELKKYLKMSGGGAETIDFSQMPK